MCVSKLTLIGSDNSLSPGWRQAIISINAGILLIWPLGTNFSENVIGIQIFALKKMHLKMSFTKWHPFCLGLNCVDLKLDMKLWMTTSVLNPWWSLSPTQKTFYMEMEVLQYSPLTHLPLDKMAAISQTISSDAFLWIKSLVFWSKFQRSLFWKVL